MWMSTKNGSMYLFRVEVMIEISIQEQNIYSVSNPIDTFISLIPSPIPRFQCDPPNVACFSVDNNENLGMGLGTRLIIIIMLS